MERGNEETKGGKEKTDQSNQWSGENLRKSLLTWTGWKHRWELELTPALAPMKQREMIK